MKTLTQLSATHTEAEFNPRGTHTELHYEDERCKGWFVGVMLSSAGLKFRARRPDGASVAIPLDDMIALVREHAPEVFASAEAIAAAQAAREGRAVPQGGAVRSATVETTDITPPGTR